MKKKYGYDNGKRGLEAEYEVIKGTMKVKVFGADHWKDYFDCLFAWPRVCFQGAMVHRVWHRMATDLAAELRIEMIKTSARFIDIDGFSMGGAVGVIAGIMLSDDYLVQIRTVNAPKIGDHWASWLAEDSTDFTDYYDYGDVVRHLPLFYRKALGRSVYANTKPFWKAHNNMPEWWSK